jgi:hypothetical protein
MSTCPHCYVGLCKKHPRQDSGMREKMLAASKAEVQKRLFDSLIKPKMDKLAAEKKGTSAEEIGKYKKVRPPLRLCAPVCGGRRES